MRDIKFRAWDKKNKEWISDTDSFFNGMLFNRKVGSVGIDFWSTKFELMQYTGLKDQNGKEIYEGDIIINSCIVSPTCPHCKKKLYAERQPEVVKWNDFGHRFDMPYIDAFQTYLILGNIHENPELLEVTK